MAQAETGGSWWICTGPLWQGGKKILGPFEGQELALRVRSYVEAVPMAKRFDPEARGYATFWVDHEARTGACCDCPGLGLRTEPPEGRSVMPVSAEGHQEATAHSDNQQKPLAVMQNTIAAAVMEACGFVPLTVRYKAADAALSVVQEWRDKRPIGPESAASS